LYQLKSLFPASVKIAHLLRREDSACLRFLHFIFIFPVPTGAVGAYDHVEELIQIIKANQCAACGFYKVDLPTLEDAILIP